MWISKTWVGGKGERAFFLQKCPHGACPPARFYYMLLTKVSGTYMQSILSMELKSHLQGSLQV
jgi:hypothetical protein